MAELHGKAVAHNALLGSDGEGGYESPDEYAEQGDTRKIRDLMFGYTVEQEDAAGNTVISTTEAMRGDVVTLDQIGLIALAKGESNHSFYTSTERERIENPTAGGAAPEGAGYDVNDLSSAGEYELADWLQNENPTINEVLEVVGDDKEFAHRMLQAENIATDGDPRKGLETGLTAVIQA